MNVNEHEALVCWGRRGYQCDQPIARLAVIEAQFGDVLGRLAIPDDELRAALQRQDVARPRVNTEAVERTMERLRRQYAWGHIEEADYLRQYVECTAALAQAHEEVAEDDALTALGRLRDLGRLWRDGTPEERHRIAALVVRDVLIDGRRVVAVQPQEPWQALVALVLQPAERVGYLAV